MKNDAILKNYIYNENIYDVSDRDGLEEAVDT